MKDEKQAVREKALAERNALSAEEISKKSAAIFEKAVSLGAFKAAGSAGCYVSVKSEAETGELIEECWRLGKKVCVPVTLDNGKIFLSQVSYFGELHEKAFGLLEPRPDSAKADYAGIGIVFVPGVAFDLQKNRVGYGRGYYDSLLAEIRRVNKKALFAGLAFECQVFEKVPAKAKDVKMDLVMTEKRVIK